MIDYLRWLYADFPTAWDIGFAFILCGVLFAAVAYEELTYKEVE